MVRGFLCSTILCLSLKFYFEFYYYYLHFCTLIYNEETLSGSLMVELELSEIRMETMTPYPLIAVCGDSIS